MPGREPPAGARRQLTICNACRYCEGYCVVFPALKLRGVIQDGDVTYLANLCHDCRNCYDACMFAPPHEFAINIPALLAEERARTYERYGWPAVLARWVRHSDRATAGAALGGLLVVGGGVAARLGATSMVFPHIGPGAFSAVVPYLAMVLPALLLSLWGLAVVAAGVRQFWNDICAPSLARVTIRTLAQAAADALSQRYFRGRGAGCCYPHHRGSTARSVLHALVLWGVLLDLAATILAAVYQDILGKMPSYPVTSAPMLSGIAGGILLIIGTSGLLALKAASDPVPASPIMTAMDDTFLILVDLVAATGMLLLAVRTTRALGPLLVLHLGVLVAFFLMAPYAKFVHLVSRYLALVKYRAEDLDARGR